MQRTLCIEIDGEQIISKPWDFEAMCMIDDARSENPNGGRLRLCTEAVHYLFEGTAATESVLKSLSPQSLTAMSLKVFGWYNQDMGEAVKNV